MMKEDFALKPGCHRRRGDMNAVLEIYEFGLGREDDAMVETICISIAALNFSDILHTYSEAHTIFLKGTTVSL